MTNFELITQDVSTLANWLYDHKIHCVTCPLWKECLFGTTDEPCNRLIEEWLKHEVEKE